MTVCIGHDCVYLLNAHYQLRRPYILIKQDNYLLQSNKGAKYSAEYKKRINLPNIPIDVQITKYYQLEASDVLDVL